MRTKEFTSQRALELLKAEGQIDYFSRKVIRRKQYWTIGWSGEERLIKAAVGATQYQDNSENVPFGIQNELIRQGVVDEVVLIFRDWDYVYRIPVKDFRAIETTVIEGRQIFQVNKDGHLCSDATFHPVDLIPYQIEFSS